MLYLSKIGERDDLFPLVKYMVSPKTCLILKIRLLIFVFHFPFALPVQVKEAARADPFKSAAKLVEEAMREVDPIEDVVGLLPHVENLQRSANRAREGLRPTPCRPTGGRGKKTGLRNRNYRDL